jgi:LysR family transcriptional regulator, chromosome initiation inhibitor
LRGCVAEPLGTMRYRCLAAPSLQAKLLGKKRSLGLHQLLTQPAIGFNRKDGLQDEFLRHCFGVSDLAYPRHYIPAVDAYRQGLLSGLGWGMQADIQAPDDVPSGRLVDLFPGQFVDVPLFWHHWQREAPQAGRLTLAIKTAALRLLLV